MEMLSYRNDTNDVILFSRKQVYQSGGIRNPEFNGLDHVDRSRCTDMQPEHVRKKMYFRVTLLFTSGV
jgi:hypothetical protein